MSEDNKKKLESLINVMERAIPKMPNSSYYSIIGRAEAIAEMSEEQNKNQEEKKEKEKAAVTTV